jgi:prepilin-type N-terminal cleavage/methylation domain-containing protein
MNGHDEPRAFTLVEVIVALSVLLILAAVATPSLTGFLDQKRIDATAAQLAEVRDGLSLAGSGFRQGVGANAGALSELTTQIWNANSGTPPFPRNSCGNTFSNGQVNSWDNSGPYVNFFIAATGLVTPIGVAEDTLHRIPKSATAGVVQIVITNVSESDAALFDATVDGSSGSATGTIQWTAPVGGLVTVFYQMPINNRC